MLNINNRKQNTIDKILSVAENLISTKGYSHVTIKSIASAASVSEMTVYRNFGTKQEILDAIINKYPNSISLKYFFENNLKYDLEKDLLEVSRLYHNLMNQHKQVYLISIMERNNIADMHLILHKHAEELRELLIEYFKTMQFKEKVIDCNSETQALMFMNFNYGKFVSDLLANKSLSSLSLDDYLKEVVSILVKGLKP